MTIETAIPIIKDLHPGASYKIEYVTDAWTSAGVKVVKHVVRAVRLGVRYSHIKGVQSKGNGLPGNGKWVVDRFIYEDSKGYKLRVTNGAFGKSDVSYWLNGQPIDSRLIDHGSGHKPIVQAIKLENVISINKRRI